MVPLVAWSREERDRAHQAKLEHIREQVASGALVIRQMTKAERAHWERRHAALEAKWIPEERARREVALKNRRQRANMNRGQ